VIALSGAPSLGIVALFGAVGVVVPVPVVVVWGEEAVPVGLVVVGVDIVGSSSPPQAARVSAVTTAPMATTRFTRRMIADPEDPKSVE
jgi:hypothetical protein